MSHVFPSLDALTDLPRAGTSEAMAEWVTALNTVPVAQAKATGWTPPSLAVTTAPPIDLDAERVAAQDEGFRVGYAQGQRAGRERGIAEGRRDGREEGRQEVLAAEQGAVAAFAAELENVLEQVGPAVNRWQEAVEARAAELAMDVVRTLLAAELALQTPDAIGIVREALGHAEGAVRATIRLAPFDRAALAERKEEILQACASLRDVELVDDRSITGGCVIETEQGVVDATLATRLSLLEAA